MNRPHCNRFGGSKRTTAERIVQQSSLLIWVWQENMHTPKGFFFFFLIFFSRSLTWQDRNRDDCTKTSAWRWRRRCRRLSAGRCARWFSGECIPLPWQAGREGGGGGRERQRYDALCIVDTNRSQNMHAEYVRVRISTSTKFLSLICHAWPTLHKLVPGVPAEPADNFKKVSEIRRVAGGVSVLPGNPCAWTFFFFLDFY